MSQEIRKILPVIFLIVAIVLGWLSWQGYGDVLVLQDQIKESEKNLAVLNSAAEKANNFIYYVNENPDASEKLNIALSNDSNKPSLTSFLASATFSNGLMLKNIDFTDPKTVPAVAAKAEVPAIEKPSTQEIKMVFSGTYSALKNFLSFTEKSLKLVDVAFVDFGSSSVLAAKDSSQVANYDFTVGLKTYYMAKNDDIAKESKISIANDLVDLSFVKGKQFMDLVPPQNYKIDTTDTGDWGNKNIF